MMQVFTAGPRQSSMGFRELFAFGPIRFIWPWWVGGVVLVAIWLRRPGLRIAAVASPEICAVLCGALAGMLAAIARARYVRRAGAGLFLVAVSIALGVAVGYAAARFEFQPLTEQASPCAPAVATRESTIGGVTSRVLPVLLMLAWSRWIFAGLKAMPGTYDASNIVRNAQQLFHMLPLRIGVTLALIAVAFVFYRLRLMPIDALSAGQVVERMRRGGAAAILLANTPRQTEKVEAVRQSRAADAERRLAELDLDGARPLVRDAGCSMLLPGKKPEATIVRAEEAFAALDREIESELTTWKPSAVSGRMLLALVPIRVDGGSARLPFLWAKSRMPDEFSVVARSAHHVGTYRHHKMFDASIVMAQGTRGTRNVAVAMKLVGTVGIDSGLPETLTERLGVEPVDGVQAVGDGAMCAVWEVGDIRVRIGPAMNGEVAPTPTAPLWLTYYETPVAERLRNGNALPQEIVTTYACGALQVQSH